MTDNKRDEFEEFILNILLSLAHGYANDKRAIEVKQDCDRCTAWIMTIYKSKIREEMLALLPGKAFPIDADGDIEPESIGECKAWNNCIDEIRKKIEEKYK